MMMILDDVILVPVTVIIIIHIVILRIDTYRVAKLRPTNIDHDTSWNQSTNTTDYIYNTIYPETIYSYHSYLISRSKRFHGIQRILLVPTR